MAAITSAQTGNWSEPATWDLARLPEDTDTVVIADGHTVTINASLTFGNTVTINSGGILINTASFTLYKSSEDNILTINSGGEYRLRNDATIGGTDTVAKNAINNSGLLNVPYDLGGSYTLTMRGNYTGNGEWRVGTSENRLTSTDTFTIAINHQSGTTARLTSLTIPSGATGVKWYGAEKTTDTTLAANVTAGTDPTITVSEANGWRAGDIIVLVDETDRTKTEELVIASGYTSGTSVPLTGTLSNNKTSGWLVFNLSSNIIVKNYNDSYRSYLRFSGSSGTKQHVMSHVMLNNLGDSTESAIQIGRNITDNSNNNFKINCYKCYQPSFTDSVGGNSIEKLTSYLSGGYGFSFSNNCEINTLNTINPTNTHIYQLNTGYVKLGTFRMCGGATYGLFPESIFRIDIDTLYAVAVASGVSNRYAIYNMFSNICIGTATIKNGVYAINNQTAGTIYIKQLNCSGNTSGDINVSGNGSGGIMVIEKCQLDSTTPVLYSNNGGRMFVTEYNGTAGYNRVFQAGNILSSETTTYKTTSPSLNVYVTNTIPILFSLSSFARTAYVTSGKTVTLACYSRKDVASTGASAKLRISKGTDGHGLSEVTEYDILPVSTNTWTSQSLNLGTTTSAGFISIEVVVKKGTDVWNLYIDDLEITES